MHSTAISDELRRDPISVTKLVQAIRRTDRSELPFLDANARDAVNLYDRYGRDALVVLVRGPGRARSIMERLAREDVVD